MRPSSTSPSSIGITVIEKMTSKLVFAILVLLLAYSIFDMPQISLRKMLYESQLQSLVLIQRATNSTNSSAFNAARDALILSSVGNADWPPVGVDLTPEYLNSTIRFKENGPSFPRCVYIKVAGIVVFNMSEVLLNLIYGKALLPSGGMVSSSTHASIARPRSKGLAVEDPECEDVAVFDKRLEIWGEARDQIYVTILMVGVIAGPSACLRSTCSR